MAGHLAWLAVLLLYIRCKSGVTFIRRRFRDVTGGPVQGESPPVLVKESHIQTYSRTSECGRTYLGVIYRKDRIS